MCCRLFNNQSRDRYVYKNEEKYMAKNHYYKCNIHNGSSRFICFKLFFNIFNFNGAVLGIILSMIKERKTL